MDGQCRRRRWRWRWLLSTRRRRRWRGGAGELLHGVSEVLRRHAVDVILGGIPPRPAPPRSRRRCRRSLPTLIGFHRSNRWCVGRSIGSSSLSQSSAGGLGPSMLKTVVYIYMPTEGSPGTVTGTQEMTSRTAAYAVEVVPSCCFHSISADTHLVSTLIWLTLVPYLGLGP